MISEADLIVGVTTALLRIIDRRGENTTRIRVGGSPQGLGGGPQSLGSGPQSLGGPNFDPHTGANRLDFLKKSTFFKGDKPC